MIKTVLSSFVLLLFVACSTKNLSPVNVSDYFWSAQKEKKFEDAKRFVRESDRSNISLQKGIIVKRYIFKDVIYEGESARIPTHMYLEGIFSSRVKDEVEVVFETYLEKTQEGWKVNIVETKQALYIEVAKNFSKSVTTGIMGEVNKQIGNFKQLIDVFKKSLEK